MNRRAICAALLVAGTTVVTGADAGAAPSKACEPGDKLTTVDVGSQHDLNGNGLVCAHSDRYHAPKKRGPSSPSITYYDDL